MAAASGQPLDMPPFPALKWDEYFWAGKIKLNSWRGFQSRLGAYASTSSAAPSDGTVRLSLSPPDKGPGRPPSAAQANAYRYLLENEAAIRDTIVAAFVEAYPEIREWALDQGTAEEDEVPELRGGAEQMRRLIGLSTIHVLPIEKDDAAYVGFEFGCNWDVEHGAGVMTHQGRIVEVPHLSIGKVNQADVASTDWVAEADAEAAE